MIGELWFEEDLIPTDAAWEEVLRTSRGPEEEEPHLKVRVGRPRWKHLGAVPLRAGEPGSLYLVRIRLQFAMHRASLVQARCEAHLWPVPRNAGKPVVYDLYPRALYEGEPRAVEVRLDPSLKIGEVEASVASAAWEVAVGQVQPVVVGYPGEDEGAPYWEVFPRKGDKRLVGIQDFWLAVETPADCPRFRLGVMVKGTARVRKHFLVWPETRIWEARPTMVIGR